MPLVGWIVLAALVVAVFVIIALNYKKVGPSQVLVISGRSSVVTEPDGRKRKVGYRLQVGGGTFVIPFVETVDQLPVEVQSIATKKAGVVPRSRLAEILQPRAEELFQLVYDEVRSAGLERTLNAGIVLTGGGSHLPGLCEVAEGIFDHQTRVGEPLGVQGLTALVGSADYATAVGLVVYGSHQRGREGAGRSGGSSWRKVSDWFKDLF